MLEFSRVRTGGEEPFEVAEALRGVDELMGGLLGSGLRLVVEAAPGLPRAAADRREFEAVLVNLAANARDAMPQGGEVRVTADLAEPPQALQRPGPWIAVRVVDTGRGMVPEVLQRAGEPFFTTKPPGQGTGLGLMMARHFAERLGGTLTIESRAGLGTTVTLWLPAAAAMVPA
jgi:signal transduction histidine kinase